MKKRRPIGVFDSGVGGLTVLDELIKWLPHENFIYIGDTKNAPYGTRTNDEVKQLVSNLAHYLEEIDCKLIVIACNTGTVNSDHLVHEIQTPFIGVVVQTAEEAIRVTHTKNVLVLGTTVTIRSGVYQQLLKDRGIRVFSKDCPELVTIVEENLVHTELSHKAVYEAIHPFRNLSIDTVLLGCTHFSLLANEVKSVLGDVKIVTSGVPTAKHVKAFLEETELLNDSSQLGTVEVLTTGHLKRFQAASSWFKHAHQLNVLDLD